MENRNKITPVGLKGKEINARMIELMGIKPINENHTKSVVELTKIGPDGNAYAIVRENHEYYIKTTNKKSNIITEDFNYIGGLQNKKSEAYPSYAKAIKHLNLKFNSLAESFDKGHNINVFENDNLLNENAFAGGFANHPKSGGFTGEGNLEGNTPLFEAEEENNPWAICTSSVGREDKDKYEACVMSVKKEKGIEESMTENEYCGMNEAVELSEAEKAIQEMMTRMEDDDDYIYGKTDDVYNYDSEKDPFEDYDDDEIDSLVGINKEKNIDEAFKTQDELNQFAGHDDYQWYIVNPKGEIVGGNEYLRDAFDSFVEYSTQGEEANYLYVNDSENEDAESLHDMADNFLSSYGYGEPGDDLDDYDQGELDEFVSYFSTKIPFARFDYGEGEELGDQFINGFRIVKKDDGMYESKKEKLSDKEIAAKEKPYNKITQADILNLKGVNLDEMMARMEGEEEPAKAKDMTDEERKKKDDDYYRSTGHATGDWGPPGDRDYGMVKVDNDDDDEEEEEEEEKPTLGHKIKSFLGFKKSKINKEDKALSAIEESIERLDALLEGELKKKAQTLTKKK